MFDISRKVVMLAHSASASSKAVFRQARNSGLCACCWTSLQNQLFVLGFLFLCGLLPYLFQGVPSLDELTETGQDPELILLHKGLLERDIGLDTDFYVVYL